MKSTPAARGTFRAPLQKKVKKEAGSGRPVPVSMLEPADSIFDMNGAVADGAELFETLSGPSLLALVVGVGAQLTAQLGPLTYAWRETRDQAGHLAVLVNVRDTTTRQLHAVSEAVVHLLAAERVLDARLQQADDAVHGMWNLLSAKQRPTWHH